MSRIDREVRRQEMVAALTKLAEREGNDVTLQEYCRHLECCDTQVYRYFASWGDLREAAGLSRQSNARRTHAVHTQSSLLAALAEVAGRLGPTVSLQAFERASGISTYPIKRVFGSWQAFKEAAGLPEPNKPGNPPKWSRESVRELVRETLGRQGGQLTLAEFCASVGISSNTVYRHGGWVRIRRKLGYFDQGRKPWLEENDPLNVLMSTAEWERQLNLMLGRGDAGPAPAGRGRGGGVAGESGQAGA